MKMHWQIPMNLLATQMSSLRSLLFKQLPMTFHNRLGTLYLYMDAI